MDTNILQCQSEFGEEYGQVKPHHKREVVYQFHKTRKRQHNTVQTNIKVNGKCEEPRNNMVLLIVKISEQNNMEENGAAHCSKMMASICKSVWHQYRWHQSQSDSNELWLDSWEKGSEIYLYITAKGQSYCHSVVTSITHASYVGRCQLPTHDTSIHGTIGT